MSLDELGQKIRIERKTKGWTLKELSNRVGISVMTLQRIETNQVSPSVALLLDIARCLDRQIGFFLDERLPTLQVFSRQEISQASDENRDVVEIIPLGLVSNDLAVQIETGRLDKSKLPRASQGVEAIHVLTGQAEVVHRGRKTALSAGETVYYDASVKHTLRLPQESMVVKVVKTES
jgi:transcriptional regulator with XRE-family HTH domain